MHRRTSIVKRKQVANDRVWGGVVASKQGKFEKNQINSHAWRMGVGVSNTPKEDDSNWADWRGVDGWMMVVCA
jgi:hypothetical protein